MASSEVAIFGGIVAFFVLTGFVAPYLNATFNAELHDNTYNDVDGVISSDPTVDATEVTLSLITIWFWSFGNIPALIDAIIFIPLRLIMLYLLVRLLRGGG